MGTENQGGVSKRELLHRRDKFQLFLAPPKRFAKASLICIQPFLLFCLFLGGLPAFAQSGQKYSTGLNILTATDGLGSSNYEGLNFFTNNSKRGYFTKDGEFALLTRGYFLSNIYCDSLLTSWKVSTQEIQTVTAKITGNAQIDGTLTIGGAITIDGANSRISSSTGTIDFDANHLTTTGNISAGNIAAQTATVTDSLTANHVTSNHLTSNNVTTNNVAANNVTSNFVTTNQFTANQATTNQVTSNLLSSDTITANQLTANKLTLNSFAGTHEGLLKYNTSGTINRLDFPSDTNAVLTGGGAFKNLGSMVAPYTGWQWQGSDLVSMGNDVYIPNSLHVAKTISIGPFKIKNGGATDTIRTSAGLALVSDAQDIQINAQTVTMSDAVGIGTRPAFGYALDVAGNIRSSGLIINTLTVNTNSYFSGSAQFNSLTGNNEALTALDTMGKLIRKPFSGNGQELLTGDGSFQAINTLTGWNWAGNDISTGQNVKISRNLFVDSILTSWKTSSQEITAGTLQVSGNTTLHHVTLTDGVQITSLAGTKEGLLKYNTSGTINTVDFPTDTNAVLTGGGAFKNLGSLVAPYTGWQWYNANVLLSTAPVVAIQNNLAVGGKVSIGSLRMSNGSATDTLTTDRRFALEAEKIFLKADTVVIKERLAMTRAYSPTGTMELKADTVTISGLQVTGDANILSLEAQQADTISIPSPVVIGKDTSKYAPPVVGDVALKVAGSATVKGDVAVKGTVSSNEINAQNINTALVSTDSLEVNGSIHIRDSVKIGNSIWLGGIGPNPGDNSIYSTNGPLLLQSSPLNFNTIFNAVNSGKVVIGNLSVSPIDKFNVAGNSFFDGEITVSQRINLPLGAQNGYVLTSNPAGVGEWRPLPIQPVQPNFWTESGNNIYNNNSENVGIGTASPQAKLHIKRESDADCSTSFLRLEHHYTGAIDGCSWDQPFYFDFKAFSETVDPQLRIYSNFLTTPIITYEGMSGFVGIGIPSPSEKLEVAGNIKANGLAGTGNRMVIADATGKLATLPLSGTGNPNWSITGNSGTTEGTNFIGTTDAVDFVIKTLGWEQMRIMGTGTHLGNIGLGTSNPQKKLHLRTTHLTSAPEGNDAEGTHQGIRLENWVDANSSIWDIEPIVDINNGLSKFTIGPPVNPLMTITANGNVGIGTDNPLSKFHIEEQSGISPFRITAGTTTKFFITDTGNVGIGTDNPLDKLHIGGGGGIRWGNSSQLSGDQGGSIELGGKLGIAGTGTPFIDFHFDGKAEDFNARIINGADKSLSFVGADYNPISLVVYGNMGIGTPDIPAGYKLAVNGIIIAEDVNILLKGDWPDFVYDESYKPMSLLKRRESVFTEHHMPNMAPATKRKTKGSILSETLKGLTWNMEEHDLYLFEHEDRIITLEKEIKEQKETIQKQQEMIEKLLKLSENK